MNPRDGLKVAQLLIENAKNGDADAIALLRDMIRGGADSSPDNELIEMAEFSADLLRRHIKRSVENN